MLARAPRWLLRGGICEHRTAGAEGGARKGWKRERRGSEGAGAGADAPQRPAPPPKRARPPTPAPAHYPDLEPKPEVATGDDRDGHLVYKPGENITNRFKIMGDLGEGTFAKVLECWDRLTGSYVALKVVRNVPKYRSAAMLELEALNTVRRYDSTGRARVVRLLEWFDWRGHICMVFERLGLPPEDKSQKHRADYDARVQAELLRALLEINES